MVEIFFSRKILFLVASDWLHILRSRFRIDLESLINNIVSIFTDCYNKSNIPNKYNTKTAKRDLHF